jgi:uncharacterized integral membrane protein
MKAKIIIFMILIVLFTIFVSQNTSIIDIKAFFWKFEMSTIVLISLTGFVGLILGFILASIFNKKKKIEKINKDTVKENNMNKLEQDTKTKPNI